MGKTSLASSRFNVPGKWAWLLMESPAFLIMGYCMYSIPRQEGLDSLPWANWTMAGVYIIHYIYRSVITTFITPSMSPMHIVLALGAVFFNYCNAASLGGWLGGYGPTTVQDWSGRLYYIEIGLIIWGWAFLGNIFHDEDLREIRRSALKRQRAEAEKSGKPIEGVQKLYMMPKNGLFHYILFPHYVCEWIEWCGFWMIGGMACVPARTFVVNEVSTMLPRALQGKRWYVEKFGKERVGNRGAVFPKYL